MPTKDFIFRLIGETKGMERLNQQSKKASINMKELAFRAAAVIPTWILLRSTILALPRAISAATKEWASFQTEMSRVATVTRGNAEALGILEDQIRSFTATSKASFKDTASAVYALGSAGLDVAGQFRGLEHVMNVAIGTGGSVEMTAKLMAGAVNVFGKSLKDATTQAQQFKKIGDTIAYTYSTQQVELAELATALGYVASVGSLVDIEFEELVTTIGVLNTGMLKGSKSGTSLVNAFIQLANKSERLGTIGIKVDTSKPLDFLDVMTQLEKKFGSTELSVDGLSKIMSVFGIRGGRAVGLLLTNWKFFQKSLADSKDGATDFAEIMKRIAEDNVPALGIKIRNSFTGIWMDVLDQWETPFKQFLKNIQSALDDFRASEQSKEFFGETTTAQGVAKGIPQVGVGTAAFFAGRALPGIQRLFPEDARVEARATEIGQRKVPQGRIPKGQPGAGQIRPFAANTQTISQRRTLARTELGLKTNSLSLFAGGLGLVAKSALLAYGGLKLIQGSLNAFAPNNPNVKKFNQYMSEVELGFNVVALSVLDGINSLTIAAKIFKKEAPVASTAATSGIGGVTANAVKEKIDATDPLINFGLDLVKQFAGKVIGKQLAALPGASTVVDASDSVSAALLQQKQFEAADAREKSRDTEIWKQFRPLIDAAVISANTGQGVLTVADAIAADIKAENEAGSPEIKALLAFTDKLIELDTAGFQAAEANDLPGLKKYETDLIKTMEDFNKAIEAFALVNDKYSVEDLIKIFQTGLYTDDKTPEQIAGAVTQRIGNFGAQQTAKGNNISGTADAALLKVFNADLQAVYDTAEVNSFKLFNLSEDQIALKEIEVALKRFNAINSEAWGETLTMSDLSVENADKLTRLAEQHKGQRAEILALQKQALEITQKEQQEILNSGAFVRDAFKNVFSDAFEGGDFNSILDGLTSTLSTGLKESFSNLLGDALTDLTGADSAIGSILKGLTDGQKNDTNPIAQAHLDGITRGAALIRKAHEDGMAGKKVSPTYGSAGTTAYGVNVPSVLGPRFTIGGKTAGYKVRGAQPGTRNPYGTGSILGATGSSTWGAGTGSVLDATAGPNWGSSSAASTVSAQRSQLAKNAGGQFGSNLTYGNLVGGVGAGIVGGSSFYQSAGGGEGGALAATAGVLGAAGSATLALAGSAATFGAAATGAAAGGAGLLGAAGAGLTAIGPVGWIALGALAIASAIGLFSSPEAPTQRTEQIQEQTQQLASRIDITNSSLSWVNRNLIELRQELTYIMKESFYFSEKSEAERFAIDSSRGNL